MKESSQGMLNILETPYMKRTDRVSRKLLGRTTEGLTEDEKEKFMSQENDHDILN